MSYLQQDNKIPTKYMDELTNFKWREL